MLTFRVSVTKDEAAGATDANCTRIVSIDFLESLGYRGCGREEHSGENRPRDPDDLFEQLADNRASQLVRGHA
jgi:hypothetical protein